MSFVPFYMATFPMQCFSLLFEGQVHKNSELGIMTNVVRNRLVKVIFTNITLTK